MESNFSLFFGLAIQLYEMTLVSNQSKFDQFQLAQTTFTAEEFLGLELFQGTCGVLPQRGRSSPGTRSWRFRDSTPRTLIPAAPSARNSSPGSNSVFVDEGIYNIGVKPTANDLGRGGFTPAFDTQRASGVALAGVPAGVHEYGHALVEGQTPGGFGPVRSAADRGYQARSPDGHGQGGIQSPDPAQHRSDRSRTSTTAATGTLMQTVDFYARGGNFPAKNARSPAPGHRSAVPAAGPADPPAGPW